MVHNWFLSLVVEDISFLKQLREGDIGVSELKELIGKGVGPRPADEGV